MHNNFVLFVFIIIPSTDVFFFIYIFNVDYELFTTVYFAVA